MKEFIGQGLRAVVLVNISFGVNFAGNLLLVRLLNPKIFGQFALAMALVGVVEVFTTFSLQTVYLQRRHSPRLVAAILQLMSMIAAAKIAVAACVFFIVATQYDSEIWNVFTWVLLSKLMVPFNALLMAMLEKRLQFAASAFVTAIANSTGLVAAVGAAALGGGLMSLIARELIPTALTLCAGVYLNRKLRLDVRIVNPRQTRALLRASAEIYSVRASELAFTRLPSLILQRLFGLEVLGLLQQILYLVNSVNRVLGVLNQQIALVYFNRYRRDQSQTARGVRLLLAISSVCGLGVAAALFAFPAPIVHFLWGDAWANAAGMLRIMSVLVVLIPVYTILKSQLYGMRRNLWVAGTYVAGGLMLIAQFLALADALPPGAAIATAYLLTFLEMVAFSAIGVLTPARLLSALKRRGTGGGPDHVK